MTTREMIGAFQEYYGMAYSPGQGRVLVRYLDGLPDIVKSQLLTETLKSHSSTFKSLPDIAIIEGAVERAWENLREELPTKYMIAAPAPQDLATQEEIEEFNQWALKYGYTLRVKQGGPNA